MLWFKTKEQKEKERLELEERKRQEKEIEDEYIARAEIEVKPIIEYFKECQTKEEDMIWSYITDEFTDEILKSYIILEVLQSCHCIDRVTIKDIMWLFNGNAEKNQYYDLYCCILDSLELHEHDDYIEDKRFKKCYNIKTLLFRNLTHEFRIFKNLISMSVRKDEPSFRRGRMGRDTYDRGVLLMNR